MSDERLKKEFSPERADRATQDRVVTEDRVLSEDDRVEMFRQSFFQSALPDLPRIEGFHVCWLTTTNPRDPIHSRIRLGFQLIRAAEIPGWDHSNVKTGDYEGCVGVNEMVAAKLPLSLYQRYMQEAHHDAPAREEGKLTETAEFLRQQAQGAGARLTEGDGIEAMRASTKVRPPSFGDA
jgi:hypothetical protein